MGPWASSPDGNFSSCIQVLIALLSFFGPGIVGAEVLAPRVWARQFVSDGRACSTTGLTRRSSADARCERHQGTPMTGPRVPGEPGAGRAKLTWLGGRGEKRRMSTVAPSASYSLTVRLAIQNHPGMLGRVAQAVGNAGGDIGAEGLVQS